MEAIQEIVNNKVAEMVSDGTIQKLIEDNIDKAISSAISSQFKSYGNVTKQIEKTLDEGLCINRSDLPFESYNAQMLVLLKQKLGGFFKETAAEKFIAEIDNILESAPKEMPVNDFVERIVALWRDEIYDPDSYDEYATVDIGEDAKGHMGIKMWQKKKDTCSYRSNDEMPPDLNLFIIDGKIRINHRQNYNPTCFHSHEAYVFKLYAAGTVLTGLEDFDPDDCDLTLKDYDY